MFEQKKNSYRHVLPQVVLHGSLHDNFGILHSYCEPSRHKGVGPDQCQLGPVSGNLKAIPGLKAAIDPEWIVTDSPSEGE